MLVCFMTLGVEAQGSIDCIEGEVSTSVYDILNMRCELHGLVVSIFEAYAVGCWIWLLAILGIPYKTLG